MTKKNDFHKMVGYQIYPKSFKDSNADGIGDLQGIISKLPYLKDLGVDFIWINPIYKSPQVDGGYDIADFYAIDEMFGSMEDFKELLEKAHAQGLKVITDLVVNHTSDEHPWFFESKKSKDNPYRDYYLWADATEDEMPNDWQSFFGGPTWTYDKKTKQAYFHVFAPQQPDLNWQNPKLREEIYKMIRWWLDLGIDGFRLDAISHIQKAPWDFKITSWRGNGPWQPFMNVAGIDDYMRDMKAIFDEYGALTVGEASGVTSDKAPAWTDPKTGYIKMMFELEHNAKKPDGTGDRYGYKKTIIRWQRDMQAEGWNALYLENHDNPRLVNIFGDGSIESAQAFATSYMLLRGTPFIYQGQELGMTNYPFKDISELSAAEVKVAYEKAIRHGAKPEEALKKVTQNTRDHSRTPMKWLDGDKFTDGKPWMVELPDDYRPQSESKALFKLYQDLISLRHKEKAISDGDIKFYFERHPSAMVYTRDDKFLVLANLGVKKAHLQLPEELQAYQKVVLSGQAKPKIKSKIVLEPWDYLVLKK